MDQGRDGSLYRRINRNLIMFCSSCQEYKGIVRCNRCEEFYCVLCNPIDSELVDTEPCDHNIVEEN